VSDRENVFVATAESPAEFSTFLVERLGWEFMAGMDPASSDDLGLRGPAQTVPGLAGLRVRSNFFVEPDPEPDEIQAFDAYPLFIDLWLPGAREAAQQAEGRAFFDRLVAARPELPMLLTHGLDLLSAAYLPGQPVHDFPARTLVDDPDIELWRPWVVR
jgi:hypothetical protein